MSSTPYPLKDVLHPRSVEIGEFLTPYAHQDTSHISWCRSNLFSASQHLL